MFRIALAGAVCALAIGSAAAQPPGPAAQQQPAGATDPASTMPADPPPTTAEVVARICKEIDPEKAKSSDDFKFVKNCQDALKIQAEIEKLKLENDSTRSWLLAFGPLLGAILALIPIGLGYLVKMFSERGLLQIQNTHARSVRREEQITRMLDDLSGESQARQSFAAAGMMSLIRENFETGGKDRPPPAERYRESTMLVTALLARLRDERLSVGVVKYVADELYKLFTSGPTQKARFKVRDFNLQQVRLINAYWARLDASGADFFDADLERASFRNANLEKAVLYGANVDRAVFSGANLKGANLTAVLCIDTAVFDAQTQWNAATIWPAGFDPASRGLGPPTETPV